MIAIGVLLFLSPFLMLADVLRLIGQAQQRRRMLSPNELKLRDASRPFGFAVVVAGALALFGDFGLAAVALHPMRNLYPAALLLLLLAYGLVVGGAGIRAAWGLRDATRTFWALVRFGVGVFVVWKLWPFAPWADYGREWWALDLLRAALLVGIWCAVTGLARFLLLVIGGGSALRRARREAARRNKPLKAGKF